MNKEIINYINDQINFYKNRLKKIEKNISDKKRVGLPVTELDEFQKKIENNHILEFQNLLKEYSK